MPNELELPPELQQLLEKRGSNDRRRSGRRKSDGCATAKDGTPLPPSAQERRSRRDRRKAPRRKEERS